MFLFRVAAPAALLFCIPWTPSAWAKGQVELVLFALPGAPILAQQEWMADLGRAGITRARIQSTTMTIQPEIVTSGTADAPVYSVRGVIDTRGDVVLPGERFPKGTAFRIARWLADLAEKGPPDDRPDDSTFRLLEAEYLAVLRDLTTPVGFETSGLGGGTVVRKMADRLKYPIVIAPPLVAAMDDASVTEELSQLACGTAIAHVLASFHLGLTPTKNAAGAVIYQVDEIVEGRRTWPVGWKPDKGPRDLLPKSLESLKANVEGVPVTRVIEAVSQRLATPILVDHYALGRQGIDLEQSIARIPSRDMMYVTLLQQALFQAKVKQELRVDEAGTPFYWVTPIATAPR